MKILILIFSIVYTLFSYEKTTDIKNVYYTSEHFRVIFGTLYANDTSVNTLAKSYLDIAEVSWSKEVDYLGFKAPRNSESKKIDIYIGDKLGFDYEANASVNEAYPIAGYAGITFEYPSDNTAFFVLNPNINENITKVTIAHEFFHTIQYAYFSGNILDENIWWLEATATLIEDEVYNSINDYVNYTNDFFNASYKSFEIYNGSHEYAMVIFAKYIKEKYGFEIIKNSFIMMEEIKQSKSCFEILNTLLIENHNSSMQIAVNEFAKWVANADIYFEEGDLYPSLKHFIAGEISQIGKGGIIVVDNLKSGWNMVTLSSSDVNSLEIDSLESIWAYQSGIWSNSIENEISNVQSSQGYWVKTSAVSSLYYTYFDNGENDISTLNEEWHLFGTTEQLSMDYFDTQNIIVWHYSEGVWYAFSNDSSISDTIEKLGYKQLNSIQAYSSYWIKKI